MKKIVMVGRDKAPSAAFEKLAQSLSVDGYEVKKYLGHGDPIPASVNDIVADTVTANVLLSGMSSSPALVFEERIAICTAHDEGVPVLLYADTHGAVKRSWFADVRKYVDAIFVVSHKEAEDARGIFPNIGKNGIVLSGNPIVEESFFPKTTRQWVSERLGIREDEKMILIPGYKFPAITLPTVLATLDALDMIPNINFYVVVSLHPGDDAWKANNGIYDEWVGYFLQTREVTDLGNRVRVRVTCGKHPQEENKIATPDMLPRTDVVVATLSTLEQEAACQRIPVVEYLTAIALDRMEKNFGTRRWEPCRQGIAFEVFANHTLLADVIKIFLTPAGRKSLHPAQERHYPRPLRPGHALAVMAETVKSYVEK